MNHQSYCDHPMQIPSQDDPVDETTWHGGVTNSVEPLREKPISLDFHEVDTKTEEGEQTKDEFQRLDPKTLKLMWHSRLGHLPFATINWMARKSELPRKLANCADPLCTSCIYGQMTRRAWRTRAEPPSIAQ
jgi:hypothetical protein